jgi:hypothetical protein
VRQGRGGVPRLSERGGGEEAMSEDKKPEPFKRKTIRLTGCKSGSKRPISKDLHI